jgi:hypothetical protein
MTARERRSPWVTIEQSKHHNERKQVMKITYSVLGLAAGAALFLVNGCSKEQPPAGENPKAMNPAPSEAQQPAAEPAPAVSTPAAAPAQPPTPAASAVPPVVETPKAAAEQAPPTAAVTAAAGVQTAATQAVATAAAAAASSAAGSQVQALIDKAKGLVTNQKYQDALSTVQQLYSLKLTPEQQTLVDGLKAQIQTAMAKSAASDAASAVGNVLGGKK